MFTKRHYEVVAKTTRRFLLSDDPIQPVGLVNLLVGIFEEDNPNFDDRQFVEACGMDWDEYCMEY